MKSFPVYIEQPNTRTVVVPKKQIGVIVLDDNTVIRGDECFTYEAQKDGSGYQLISLILVEKQLVCNFTGKDYNIKPNQTFIHIAEE